MPRAKMKLIRLGLSLVKNVAWNCSKPSFQASLITKAAKWNCLQTVPKPRARMMKHILKGWWWDQVGLCLGLSDHVATQLSYSRQRLEILHLNEQLSHVVRAELWKRAVTWMLMIWCYPRHTSSLLKSQFQFLAVLVKTGIFRATIPERSQRGTKLPFCLGCWISVQFCDWQGGKVASFHSKMPCQRSNNELNSIGSTLFEVSRSFMYLPVKRTCLRYLSSFSPLIGFIWLHNPG